MQDAMSTEARLLREAWRLAGLPADKEAALNAGAALYGAGGLLDSIGVVSLIAALAELLENESGQGDSLLDRIDAELLSRFGDRDSLLDWLGEHLTEAADA